MFQQNCKCLKCLVTYVNYLYVLRLKIKLQYLKICIFRFLYLYNCGKNMVNY